MITLSSAADAHPTGSVHVAVLNAGSTSVKGALVEADTGRGVAAWRVERVGTSEAALVAVHGDGALETTALGEVDHGQAAERVLGALAQAARLAGVTVDAVGHRMVHGGRCFTAPTYITGDAMVEELRALTPLAPLHVPANVAALEAARARMPKLPHIAVFDTAFHATLPRRAQVYALPFELSEKHGLRRYGFHGTSHRYVAGQAAAFVGDKLRDLRLVTCHLGGGASVTAVEYGRSIETSMGMTPLEGLVMGTRSGDVDPGVLVTLMREEGWTVDELDRVLNHDSGLAGLGGQGADMRDLERRAAEGHERSRLALHVFCHRVRKYVGAYAAVMGGVDAIVFTGGIGENSALVRHRVAQRLEFLGARLDEDRNRDAAVSRQAPVVELSPAHSRVRILAVRTDEEHAIARAAARLLRAEDVVAGSTVALPGVAAAADAAATEDRAHHGTDSDEGTYRIPIAVSARHVHLTQEAVEALFGEGHRLTPRNPLSQPGQFACEETVTLIGPRRTIPKVRVLGPVRPACQVEVSRTDEFHLGLDAPVRGSGDVANTPGITLEGPAGRLTIPEGVICARRHIHMTPEDAVRFGVEHKDIVDVAVGSPDRELVFGDVLVRVSPKFVLEMHVDTDEANAAEISRGHEGMLVATGSHARLTRRKPWAR